MPKDSLKKNVNTAILEPPKNFGGMIRYWGPGLVMTAGVVGSGELIATTGLGAKTGFIALWLIILSCVIKVVVQLMLGRYAIYSGKTTTSTLLFNIFCLAETSRKRGRVDPKLFTVIFVGSNPFSIKNLATFEARAPANSHVEPQFLVIFFCV